MKSVKINKREIIKGLVEVPKTARRQFWAKEMTILKKLLEKYSPEFVKILKFDKKYDSLAILSTGPLSSKVESRYRQWVFAQNRQNIVVENYNLNDEKLGDNITIQSNPKTIKQFLNE